MDPIREARYLTALKAPYLSTALYALDLIPKPGMGTAGVDARWRCYYDPEFCGTLTPHELGTVIAHEVWHLLRQHHERMGARQKEAWNAAADLEINDDLAAAKDDKGQPSWQLPKGVLLPSMFSLRDGQTAEWYFDQFRGAEVDPDLMPGWGGSCADGIPRKWEDLDGDGGCSEAEAELIRRQVAKDIEHSQSQGSLPAGMRRWAQEVLQPPAVDYRRELANAVQHAVSQTAGAADYSRSRFNRRQSAYGKILMPALRRPIPRVAVVADTSGSMSESQLGEALNELRHILKAVGSEGADVVSCDAAAHSCRRVFDARRVQLLGGGGTDMGAGIAAADKGRPHVIVTLTDGITDWPTRPPRAKHICVVFGQHGHGPTWGRVIRWGAPQAIRSAA